MTNASRGSWYVVFQSDGKNTHNTKQNTILIDVFPNVHIQKNTLLIQFSCILHKIGIQWKSGWMLRLFAFLHILTSFSPAVWESSPRNRTTHIRQAGKCVFNNQSWSRTHLVTTQKDNLRNRIFVGIGLFYTKTVSWTDKVLCRWFSARLQ